MQQKIPDLPLYTVWRRLYGWNLFDIVAYSCVF